MTAAQLTHGSTVEWGTDGSTYTTMTETKTLVVPTTEVEYVDVTNMDSPNGFREFLPGLKDAGEITVECNYTPEMYDLAQGYRTNGTVVHFRTTLTAFSGQTGGDVFKFTGYVTPQVQQTPVEGAIMLNISVRVTGAVEHEAGATS